MISLPSCFNLEAVAPILTALIEVDAFLPEKPSQKHYARHPREYYSVDHRLGSRHRRLSSSEAMTASYERPGDGTPSSLRSGGSAITLIIMRPSARLTRPPMSGSGHLKIIVGQAEDP